MTDKKYEELLKCAAEAIAAWEDNSVLCHTMEQVMDALKACLPPPPPSREEIAYYLCDYVACNMGSMMPINREYINHAIEELRKEQ